MWQWRGPVSLSALVGMIDVTRRPPPRAMIVMFRSLWAVPVSTRVAFISSTWFVSAWTVSLALLGRKITPVSALPL